MNSVFASYATIRVRMFLREILQLHQRFLVGFLLFFGLILSGNEQLAIRKAMAHVIANVPATSSDVGCLLVLLFSAWTFAAVIRKSARGGRVHYLAESLPLPFAWERCVRMIKLSIINLSLLVLFFMGIGQLIKDHAAWGWGILYVAAYYAWILGMQLSLLEQSWRTIPLWIIGTLGLVISRGTFAQSWCLLLTPIVIYFSLRRDETKIHDHPELSIRGLRARWRSRLIRQVPPQVLMQLAYVLVRPGAFFYTLLMGFGVDCILYMVLKQSIPLTQKIYVYTCATGFLCLVLSSFFRNFHMARLEWQTWLTSLPQPPGWWIRQDTVFVVSIYSVQVLPASLLMILQQTLPLPVPLIVIPIHLLSFLPIRWIQRSQRLETGLLMMIGSAFWFVLIGYIADHMLRGFG